jgi:cytochrome c oxidase assembly protein subunit 15
VRPIAYWLVGTGALVAGMVTVGGITRLTKSGLSMTDWKIQVGWEKGKVLLLLSICTAW